mgnify:CR=1 FL=1
MSFENLNLNAAILKAIAETGYTEPTPIQAQAIPEIMAGNDLMASSQTVWPRLPHCPAKARACWY